MLLILLKLFTHQRNSGRKSFCKIRDIQFLNFFKPLGSTYASSGKNKMEKHVAAVHEEKEPFKCDVCDYSFQLKSRTYTSSGKNMLQQFMKRRNHSKIERFGSFPKVVHMSKISNYSGSRTLRKIADIQFSIKNKMEKHVASKYWRIKRFINI